MGPIDAMRTISIVGIRFIASKFVADTEGVDIVTRPKIKHVTNDVKLRKSEWGIRGLILLMTQTCACGEFETDRERTIEAQRASMRLELRAHELRPRYYFSNAGSIGTR